ncbi:hypothetical protein FA95DRAFT_680913 [Auriscalpium vulgare]|uniref:Uncharacterized protein n=1 Tax=Auriscalpium vulgare TaxID=40419 RepID=A0ACB8RBW0_9AGAM|nr:hypothetical protein FA95DRAFT_680913 [Auriscalpium vulgare]
MDHNGNSHPSQPPNPHDHAQLLAQRQADDAVMHQLATVGVTPQQYAENLQRLQALASMNEVGLRVYAQRQAELAQEGRLAEQRLQQLNEMGILPNQVQGRPVARIQGPPTPVQPAQPYAHAPAAQTWTQAVPVQPTPSSSAAQTPRPAPQHPFNPHSYPYQPYYPPAHYQASNANLRSQSSQNVHYSGGHVAPAKAQATGSTVAGTQSSLNTSGTSGPGHTYAQPVVNRQSERPLSSTSHTEEVRRHPEQEHFGLPSRQPLRPPSHQQPGLPLNHQGRPEGQPGAPQARADGQAERILTFGTVDIIHTFGQSCSASVYR